MMNKSNIDGSTDKREVNPEWFTGKTWMKVLSEKIRVKDQDIYHVHFEKGSRTKLHFHNGNQVLMAIKGKGSLEIFKKYGTNKSEFKIKRTQRINLNQGTLFTFQQKHYIHMDPLTKRKNFLILQSTYCLKRIQHTKLYGMNQILKTKLQKLFRNNVNKRRFKN